MVVDCSAESAGGVCTTARSCSFSSLIPSTCLHVLYSQSLLWHNKFWHNIFSSMGMVLNIAPNFLRMYFVGPMYVCVACTFLLMYVSAPFQKECLSKLYVCVYACVERKLQKVQ